MFRSATAYFRELTQRFGDGWNRFWFAAEDPYLLGVLRVATGLVALYVHLSYTPDLQRFFAADGLAPLDVVESLESSGSALGLPDSRRVDVPALSYLSYLSTPRDLAIAHWLSAAVLVVYTIGWRTRVAAVLALVVTLAYVQRGPMFTALGEPVLTLVMFYLALGPCGASWSLDAWLRRRSGGASPPGRPSVAANVSLRLMQVHLALFIAVMGLSKLMGEVWWSGDAIWLLFARTETRLVDLTGWAASRLGDRLLDLWCHAQVALELMLPILIWHRLARPLILAWSTVMWLLLALALGQEVFLAMMLIGNLAFVDSAWLRGLLGRRVAAAA